MTEVFRESGMTRHLLPAFQFHPNDEDSDNVPDIPASGPPIYRHRPDQPSTNSGFRRVCSETRPHTHHGRQCTYEHVPAPRGFQSFRPRPWLNKEFQDYLQDFNGLSLDHFKDVQEYADELWEVYVGVLQNHERHGILEGILKMNFIHGLDERFNPWRTSYLREKQLVGRIDTVQVTEWTEVVLDAIAEETRLDQLEARAAREAEIAAEEEERQKARVQEDSIQRTIRTFEDLPASSVPASSHPSVETEQGLRRQVIFQDEVRREIEPRLPRLDAWLEGAELEVEEIPDEVEELVESEEEIEEVRVGPPGPMVANSTSGEDSEEAEENVITHERNLGARPPRALLGRRRRTPPPPLPAGDLVTAHWRLGYRITPRLPRGAPMPGGRGVTRSEHVESHQHIPSPFDIPESGSPVSPQQPRASTEEIEAAVQAVLDADDEYEDEEDVDDDDVEEVVRHNKRLRSRSEDGDDNGMASQDFKRVRLVSEEL